MANGQSKTPRLPLAALALLLPGVCMAQPVGGGGPSIHQGSCTFARATDYAVVEYHDGEKVCAYLAPLTRDGFVDGVCHCPSYAVITKAKK